METQNLKVNDGPAPGNSTEVLVQSRDQITTVDMFDQTRAKGAIFLATEISNSSLIPEHYQRRPENVLVAMYRAARIGVDVFAYMETTYSVGGRLGHEAKFVVSLINTSGKFETPLLYKMSGEIVRENGLVSARSTRKCEAWAVLKGIKERISQEVSIELAFREGWMTKNGPDKTLKSNKWQTMPDIMLQYRAAKFFGNMFCPELVMGLNTKDELEDIADAEVVEQTEIGKDIFEKGVEVSTATDPVIDPASVVSTAPVIAEAVVVETKPPAPAEAKPASPEQTELPLSDHPVFSAPERLPPLTDEEKKNPPDTIEGLRVWFFRYFTCDYDELSLFLLGKKWLGMGEEARDLTDAKIKDLLSMWGKFTAAFDKFKADRKAGRA